jgi:hypothetical protein
MYTGQLEQLARQRIAEHPSDPAPAARSARVSARPSLRASTGWAIVAIGLRIAETGTR